MDSLPLDVQCKKLTEWLVTRNVIQAKWQTSIAPIREKIEDAILRLPDQEIPELKDIVNESVVHYFHCRKVLSLLEDNGDAAKGWLGGYKDKQLQEWADILNAYKKNSINIGEAARILERNTIYEIPAIKNQLVRNDKEVTDLMKKVKSNEKAIVTQTKAYEQACADLGIKGKDLRNEIISQADIEIPRKLNAVLEIVKNEDIGKAIEYYEAFVKYIMQTVNENNNEKVNGLDMLSTIKLLREKGEILEEVIQETTAEEEEITIDWDMDTDTSAFEISNVEDHEQTVEIDWSADISTENETGTENEIEIDWDIDLGTGDAADTVDVAVSEEKDTVDSLRDNQSNINEFSLMNKATRTKLVNDVAELNGFLLHRCTEMKTSTLDDQFKQNADECLKQATPESIKILLVASQVLLDAIMGDELQDLLMMKQNGASLDRMVNSLSQQLSSVNKFKQSINQLEAKCEQLRNSSVELREKLKSYVKTTKELKLDVEKVLSKQFKGREVNIVGEINYI